MYKEPVRGKAAEAELDFLFGMDKESRAIITYRGQRKPGLFLSLNDEKKKSFLWNLLELGVYEKAEEDTKKKISDLELEVGPMGRLTNQVNLPILVWTVLEKAYSRQRKIWTGGAPSCRYVVCQ